MNCLSTAKLFKSPSHKCLALQRQACVSSHVRRPETRQATKCSPQRLIFRSLDMWKRKDNFLFDTSGALAKAKIGGLTEEWGLAPNGDCTDPYQPLSATLNSKMADEGAIPLVDFSVMGLNCANPPSQDDESVKLLAEKIHTAFSTIGFVYLSNHGISDEEISEVRKAGDGFFNLPVGVKKSYSRPSDGRNFGWVSLERESLNPSRPGDLKEAFNVCELDGESQRWPDKEAPEFKPVVISFFKKCTDLALRIIDVVSIGLKLKDPKWLSQVHGGIGTAENATALRLLYYPPLPEDSDIKPGQVRCGEHSDYGSITLLFQDDVGGLEVLPVNGEYTAAKPVAGTVLVNIGDLMQQWTADKLRSTKHRVLIPEEELKRKILRRSLAFFVHPDNDVMIECLDGSNKYPPITAMGYLQQRFAATY